MLDADFGTYSPPRFDPSEIIVKETERELNSALNLADAHQQSRLGRRHRSRRILAVQKGADCSLPVLHTCRSVTGRKRCKGRWQPKVPKAQTVTTSVHFYGLASMSS